MVITYILTAYVLVELPDIRDDVIVFINLLIQLASLITLGIKEKGETVKVLSIVRPCGI